MLTNEEMEDLLSGFDARMKGINDHYIRLMGEHIRDIGKLTDSDIDRIAAMQRCSKDMAILHREIAQAANISEKELEQIYTEAINRGCSFMQQILHTGTISLSTNLGLQTLLHAQIQTTQARLKNFSNTTVISKPYRDAVDVAIQAVTGGMTDYNSAIRATVRKCAMDGLRVLAEEKSNGKRKGQESPLIRFESGLTRRLDTAARQNILDGIRDINQATMTLVGEQYGADGVEVSAHMLCAVDHVDIQGMQFTKAEWEHDRWDYIGSNRDIGEWNCKHVTFPIIIGISSPAYSKEVLDSYKRYSTETITITTASGKDITKSRYDWTQEMRRLETAVRREKDVKTVATAVGDKTLIRQCNTRIKTYQGVYSGIAMRTGLPEERRRMRGSVLTTTRKSIIIKPIKINLQLFGEKDIKNQSSKSLRKGIESLREVIDLHYDKIANPEKHYPQWNAHDERFKNGCIKHFRKEIDTAEKSIQARIEELKLRGEWSDHDE